MALCLVSLLIASISALSRLLLVSNRGLPDERRESGYGRRESDRILQSIYRELDQLRERFGDDLDRLEGDLKELEQALNVRVTELVQFHIEERTKASLAVASETKRMQRLTRWSISFGIIGTAAGIVSFLLHLH